MKIIPKMKTNMTSFMDFARNDEDTFCCNRVRNDTLVEEYCSLAHVCLIRINETEFEIERWMKLNPKHINEFGLNVSGSSKWEELEVAQKEMMKKALDIIISAFNIIKDFMVFIESGVCFPQVYQFDPCDDAHLLWREVHPIALELTNCDFRKSNYATEVENIANFFKLHWKQNEVPTIGRVDVVGISTGRVETR